MQFFFILILLFTSINLNYAQTNKSVYLAGTIKNLNNQVEIEDMSDLGRLSLPNIKNTFIPDNSGTFSITMQLGKPGYFRLGRNILYLSPGDSIEAAIDFMYPENATFKGSNKTANDFLRQTPFPKGGSYIAYDEVMGATIQETIDKIIAFGERREKLLVSLDSLPPQFVILEKARIKADIINSIWEIENEFPYYHKLTGDTLSKFRKDLMDNMNNYIRPFSFSFIDSNYLQLTVYQKIAYKILEINKTKYDAKELIHIQDWLKATYYFQQIVSAKDPKKRDSIYAKVNEINNKQYKEKLQIAWEQSTKFGNGDKVINFVAENSEGLKVSLDQYAGKVILIDFWATWCGPCIAGFPAFEEIKNAFKTDSNVVCLSISIDDDKEKWNRAIKKYAISGPQWVIDRLNIPDYRIVNIPRTIIIDKSFSIYAFLGPSVEYKDEIIKVLNTILK